MLKKLQLVCNLFRYNPCNLVERAAQLALASAILCQLSNEEENKMAEPLQRAHHASGERILLFHFNLKIKTNKNRIRIKANDFILV